MLVRKTWVKRWWPSGLCKYRYTGYFLFGFIPLYISREGA